MFSHNWKMTSNVNIFDGTWNGPQLFLRKLCTSCNEYDNQWSWKTTPTMLNITMDEQFVEVFGALSNDLTTARLENKCLQALAKCWSTYPSSQLQKGISLPWGEYGCEGHRAIIMRSTLLFIGNALHYITQKDNEGHLNFPRIQWSIKIYKPRPSHATLPTCIRLSSSWLPYYCHWIFGLHECNNQPPHPRQSSNHFDCVP